MMPDNFDNLNDEVKSAIVVMRESIFRVETSIAAIASELNIIVSKYQAVERALREYQERERKGGEG